MEIGHISYHFLDHIANLHYILSIVISLNKESSKYCTSVLHTHLRKKKTVYDLWKRELLLLAYFIMQNCRDVQDI